MTGKKYGIFLTVLLVILVIAILIGGAFLIYHYLIEPNIESNKKIRAIEEFDDNTDIDNEPQDPEKPDENENLNPTITPTEQQQSNPGTAVKKTYYEGFVMLGYITISKTNVKEPILDQVTPEALNAGVAVLYPSNARLNQPGNVVIIGHNYRNGKFFSNNNKLSVGDKFTIKDNTGTELTYTIYQKFQTTEQDTSFYSRDTNGAIEVTLSTCTDDAKERIIILARAE